MDLILRNSLIIVLFMTTLIFFALCAMLLFCGHGLRRASEQLPPEQKEMLRKKYLWLKIKLYAVPFGAAIFILFLIALVEVLKPSYFPLTTTFSIKIIMAIVIVICGILLYVAQYYQMKALDFPTSYLRSFILYSIGFYIALIGLAFTHISSS